MEKKTIFLELPAEMVEEIDRRNMIGDRSAFISDLLGRQLYGEVSVMNAAPEVSGEVRENVSPGDISLVDSRGRPLGRFNINTVEGFDELMSKICSLSDDPIVRMRARRCRF